ncbi:hypothetical protein J6590_048130 [Homalodisca vitripennis]|nr:hypothetical protein J6590_048130 [Homalodisca vitripennis]
MWGVSSPVKCISSTIDPLTTSFPITFLPASCCIEAPPVAAALRHFVFTTTTPSSTLVPTSTQSPTTLAQLPRQDPNYHVRRKDHIGVTTSNISVSLERLLLRSHDNQILRRFILSDEKTKANELPSLIVLFVSSAESLEAVKA